MVNLNAPMTDAQIALLDHFEKAQLYHNVYLNTAYEDLPKLLKEFFTDDPGLRLVKSTIQSANIKEPYEIQRLIRTLNPSKPQTYQEIYVRAQFLANVCDTSVEKILRSKIFSVNDFIPDLKEDALTAVLNTKTTGFLVPLKSSEYTPSQDQGGSSGDIPTPTPAEDSKVKFTVNGTTVTCNKAYDEIVEYLPDLPEAEMILDSLNDYQNVLNVSCGYNQPDGRADFNFIQLYGTTIKFYTIHCTASAFTLEENTVVINGNP